MDKRTEAKLARLQALEQKKRLIDGLPHLHGFPWYPWAKEVFESRNRLIFVCGGNQISKSSTIIRKCIHWATAQELWKELWEDRPSIFFYLYPTIQVASVEFAKKWIPEFLPRGEFKEHPTYGWKAEYDSKRNIVACHFNSGVSVYFKTYAQDASHLQTATVSAVFADEEMPEELFPELRARLTNTRGHFAMAFTATLGQECWRATLEEKGPQAPFPTALKKTISLFDCMHYVNGKRSRWTKERIQEEIDSCPNPKEVLRRIYGKFVKAEGLAYPSFNRSVNMVKGLGPIPHGWHVYGGVDIGSGGQGWGHPSAITFVAVRPDFQFGRVFRGWRGDGIQTTAGDTFLKYLELRADVRCVSQQYDYSCKDFETIATRNGEAFNPADKRRDQSNMLLNTLFRYQMLVIDDLAELNPLARELESLIITINKSKSQDDFIDSLRYCVMPIPWDYSAIKVPMVKTPKPKADPNDRELFWNGNDETNYNEVIDAEIAEWNDYYEV